MHNRVAIATTHELLRDKAKQLANDLKLMFIDKINSEEAKAFAYLLILTPDYIGLQNTHEKRFAPFYIDFLSPTMLYRLKHASLRKELLAKAMGMKPNASSIIVDATAGLGRDSFILAGLGFNVIMLERSALLCVLLQNALDRAQHFEQTAATTVIPRLHLIHTDAVLWLTKHQNPQPDVIYLDPMFPKRQKSASVKKEMVILQNLLPKDDNVKELFKQSLACAKKRVVVKRPRLAENITDDKPNFSLLGKHSRFDIYLV